MRTSSGRNRIGTLPNPKQSPPCDAPAQGRQGLPHLSFLRESSLVSYRLARLLAGVLLPLVFQLGTLPPSPSVRFERPQLTWEEGWTIGRRKRRRIVLF